MAGRDGSRVGRDFGGIPKTVLRDHAQALIDTRRKDDAAAVFTARRHAVARYWGFTPRACRPYRARTKGNVERRGGYVKSNGLAGRTVSSWSALARHLSRWLATVADHRRLAEADGATPLMRVRADHEQLTAWNVSPPVGALRDLQRTVPAEAAIVLDTNVASVPWQRLGAKVQVTTPARSGAIIVPPWWPTIRDATVASNGGWRRPTSNSIARRRPRPRVTVA